MASYTSAWLVGSTRDASYTAFDINGDGSVSISGDFYLWHDTNAISLLDLFVAQMTTAGVAAPTAVLTRDRKVKIGSSGNFTVTWSTDTSLRDMLGFTQGNLSGASSYTAASVSTHLWSPGKPLLPGLSPLDCHGNRRPLAFWTASPSDGTPFVVSHGSRVDQSWTAASVAMSRMQTASELGGEWVTFFDDCACKGYQFMIYPEVTEESGSATDTLSTLTPALGPYVLTPSGRAPAWDLKRSPGFAYLNTRADWAIACRTVPELS